MSSLLQVTALQGYQVSASYGVPYSVSDFSFLVTIW